MRRFLLVLTIAMALALLVRNREAAKESTSDAALEKAAPAEEQVMATPVVEPTSQKAEQMDVESQEHFDEAIQAAAGAIPVFFPKAKVVARVSDPEDTEGRRKVIETVETSMKEKYVRVERTVARGENGKAEVKNEVAMVANQLMLQKPQLLAKEEFISALTKAGAVDVKEIAEDSFLATFTARPSDPRALDGFMSRVHEVAGADLTVEPNYIRKIF